MVKPLRVAVNKLIAAEGCLTDLTISSRELADKRAVSCRRYNPGSSLGGELLPQRPRSSLGLTELKNMKSRSILAHIAKLALEHAAQIMAERGDLVVVTKDC